MEDTIYNTIIIYWQKERNCRTKLTVHDKTVERAIEEAEFFGYTKPKWWQFWKSPAKVLTFR